jgi:formylglycine-generating enzyme required for sulfatase activity
VPTLGTQVATGITQSGAISGGNITSDGGSMVTHRGVVYGTVPGPTLSNSFTQNGSGVGSFSSTLSSLAPNTTYYVRAYATNSVGTAYGDEISFKTFIDNPVEMINIPAGTFSMGCTTGDTNCESDEYPVHSVILSSFLMGASEVTQELWEYMIGSNPSSFNSCGQCPVENVSWFDAVAFCNRLSESQGLIPCYYSDTGYVQVYGKNGSTWSLPNNGTVYWNRAAKGYRLPTEAEWEYAARGGETNLYSGSGTIDNVAWYASNSGNKTHSVKGLQHNGYGLYDMSGNVFEVCWDLSGNYSSTTQIDPVGASSGSFRSMRGGSWNTLTQHSRISNRGGVPFSGRYHYIGFRLARTL